MVVCLVARVEEAAANEAAMARKRVKSCMVEDVGCLWGLGNDHRTCIPP
jgi:hypothetical protein